MKPVYNAKDIMKILCVGETYAYKVIKTLNKELEESGYLTVRGRVNAKYFNERYMLDDNDVGEEGEDKNHERN